MEGTQRLTDVIAIMSCNDDVMSIEVCIIYGVLN